MVWSQQGESAVQKYGDGQFVKRIIFAHHTYLFVETSAHLFNTARDLVEVDRLMLAVAFDNVHGHGGERQRGLQAAKERERGCKKGNYSGL